MCLACDYRDMEAAAWAWAEEQERLAAEKAAQEAAKEAERPAAEEVTA